MNPPPLLVDQSLDQDLLARATGIIRDYCRWHIAPSHTETMVRDGSGRRVLMLRSLRVTNILEVTEDEEILDPDRYEWSQAGWLERKSGVWTPKLRGVTVELEHGYETTPTAIIHVIKSMIARETASPGGSVIRQQTGPFAVSLAQSAPNQAAGLALLRHEKESILAPYRAIP